MNHAITNTPVSRNVLHYEDLRREIWYYFHEHLNRDETLFYSIELLLNLQTHIFLFSKRKFSVLDLDLKQRCEIEI